MRLFRKRVGGHAGQTMVIRVPASVRECDVSTYVRNELAAKKLSVKGVWCTTVADDTGDLLATVNCEPASDTAQPQPFDVRAEVDAAMLEYVRNEPRWLSLLPDEKRRYYCENTGGDDCPCPRWAMTAAGQIQLELLAEILKRLNAGA